MKLLKKNTSRFLLLIFAITASVGSINHAKAESLGSVSHIHHVKVVENKVHVLTHEGLYELVGKNNMKLVGREKIDVMGFASLGNILIASGHPCLLYTSPSPRDRQKSRMPSSA